VPPGTPDAVMAQTGKKKKNTFKSELLFNSGCKDDKEKKLLDFVLQ
jgi:hypothetical protein